MDCPQPTSFESTDLSKLTQLDESPAPEATEQQSLNTAQESANTAAPAEIEEQPKVEVPPPVEDTVAEAEPAVETVEEDLRDYGPQDEGSLPVDEEALPATEDSGLVDEESGPEDEASAAEALTQDPFALVPALLRGPLERKGFTELTPVQTKILEAQAGADPATAGLHGRDLQISSQTGSGKTLALGMAMRSVWTEDGTLAEQGPLGLVITPTRELANQVQKELSWLYSDLAGVRVDCVTGGTPVHGDRKRLRRPPAILVGTPGRLLDHIKSGVLDLTRLHHVVLDEADEMLDMGFREELEGILETTPEERSTHMVSATFPAGIMRLAQRYQKNPEHIEGTRLGEANQDIRHIAYLIRPSDRYAALVNLLLLSGEGRTLVFVKTRADAAQVAEKLGGEGFSAMPLSGELHQTQRTRTLAAFHSGKCRILVATDVAARGLDVPEIETVIHGDLPMDHESYVHRSGRTGRAGRKGRSLLFLPHNKERKIRRIFQANGVDLEVERMPGADAVRAHQLDARRTALQAVVTKEEDPAQEHFDLARELLEGRSPVEVVARLLDGGSGSRASSSGSTAPRAIQSTNAPSYEPRQERYGKKDFSDKRAVRSEYHSAKQGGDRGNYQSSKPYGDKGNFRDFKQHGDRPESRDSSQRGDYGKPREFNPRGANDGPRSFDRPDSRAGGFQPREKFNKRDAFGPDKRGQAQRDDRPEPERRHRDHGDFSPFFVNWGFTGGANPRRVLALICRRGGLSSQEVGAIRVGPTSTQVEIQSRLANAFATSVRKPDPRDPWVRIHPDRKS